MTFSATLGAMPLIMKSYFTILFLTIFIFGCTEDDFCESGCSTVNGYFTTSDINGEKPVENLLIDLKWYYSSKLFPRNGKIGSVQTNSQGFFEFEFIPDPQNSYFLTFEPPDEYYNLYGSRCSVYGLNKADTLITLIKHLPIKGGKIWVEIENPESIPIDSKLRCFIVYRKNYDKIYLGYLDSDESNSKIIDVLLYENLSVETVKISSDSTYIFDSIYFSEDIVKEYKISW